MSTADLAATLTEWIDSKPVFPPPRSVELPEADDEPGEAGATLGYAEGQTFMIEYVDSRGKKSRRRITVWHIESSPRDNVPFLYAKCHERNAMRAFRVDRIVACIDYDGVVYDDVPAFIAASFGMSLNVAKAREAEDERRWNLIVGAVRTEAVLLCAMARCDGHVAPEEIDAVLTYLVKRAEQDGPMLADGEITRLDQYLARLRPTTRSISTALAEASQLPAGQIRQLVLAAAQVMDADERRHPAEARLLNVVATELLGIKLF